MMTPCTRTARLATAAVVLAAGAALAGARSSATVPPRPLAPVPPARLSGTGLFADVAARTLAAGVFPYAPQYALWTDGAEKRRWIRLPPGAAIDASDPDLWRFPAGARLWKEFSVGGRPVEMRMMTLGSDGAWTYATYIWAPDRRDASLAPESGVRGATESRPGVPYDVPATADCRACHEGHPAAVLGFSALQLSPDRDLGALHAARAEPGAIDLAGLAARGLVRNLSPALLARPPRVDAPTPRARAALGWLHANCASCHNTRGPLASLGLSFEQRIGAGCSAAGVLTTAVRVPAHFRPGAQTVRLQPGHPEASLVLARASSRSPLLQMPPFGTHLVDEEAVALLSAFVREDLADGPGDPTSR